jgi:hypothetical protein
METYLDDNEKNAVVAFCQNEVMHRAVKKVLLHTIYRQGVIKPGEPLVEENFVFGLATAVLGGSPTNEQLGAEVSAALKGLTYLQDGFKKLKEVRVEVPKKPKVNPAL